jgi:hypothetical protein
LSLISTEDNDYEEQKDRKEDEEWKEEHQEIQGALSHHHL